MLTSRVGPGNQIGPKVSEAALEGVVLGDAEQLRVEAEAGLTLVAQALPGLDLTPFQRALALRVLEYEIMRLEEGWVDEWLKDMATQLGLSLTVPPADW
jgi:hypothetical protein